MHTFSIRYNIGTSADIEIKVSGDDWYSAVQAAQAVWDSIDAVGFTMLTERP